MKDNFFTEEEINEQATMIKGQRLEREQKKIETNKGFTISCKNCGSEKVKFLSLTETTQATGGEITETDIYLECECGNRKRVG